MQTEASCDAQTAALQANLSQEQGDMPGRSESPVAHTMSLLALCLMDRVSGRQIPAVVLHVFTLHQKSSRVSMGEWACSWDCYTHR